MRVCVCVRATDPCVNARKGVDEADVESILN